MAGRPFLFRWGQERGFKFYDSSFASFLFFSVFSSFFSFCEWKCFISSTHHFCLFVESSSHLRWLVIVFPNSNRLFSDILLPSPPPYPLPPPPRKKLEFELITNLWRVQIVLRLVFYLHQILKILTGIYLSTLLPLYLAYRVLGNWNSCKH